MIINAVVLWFLINHQLELRAQRVALLAQADTTAVITEFDDEDEADDIIITLDTVEPRVERPRREPTPFDVDDSDLSDVEKGFLRLQQMMYAMRHGMPEPEEEIEEEEEEIIEIEPIIIVDIKAQLDSVIVALNLRNDSLNVRIDQYRADISSLLANLDQKDHLVEGLNDSILLQQLNIDSLTDEIYRLLNPEPEPIVERQQLNYVRLARIYNGMDAKKVAQLMQQMPDEDSVNVLKAMNQRKRSQIMAALPARKANDYAQLLMTLE